MTDEQFRELRYLLLDLATKMAQMDHRLRLMEEDAKRRHGFVMDAVGPTLRTSEPEPMPPDIAELFRKLGGSD